VQFVTGQARQFEERRAGVQQQVQAFARQQLAALVELGLGLGALFSRFCSSWRSCSMAASMAARLRANWLVDRTESPAWLIPYP
jgi:hypothetical protein